MKTILTFIKKEIVFSIATVLAVFSMFFVTPNKGYVNYIDFRTLALLLALMLVVQGLKSCGVFDQIATIVTKKANNKRSLALLLVIVCFFSSMLITNDVALITFVPFSFIILDKINDSHYTIYLIVLETLAANLGSMFTPIGNPQNLYLFSISNMKIHEFLGLMLPYSLVSFVLLLLFVCLLKKETFSLQNNQSELSKVQPSLKSKNTIYIALYCVLFLICILTVLRILDFRIMITIVCISVLIMKPSLFTKADYVLLFTFISFFIFIGNMKQIPAIHDTLEKLVTGNELIVSIATSQIVSNVPAAMLLSGFTTNYRSLMVGIDLGGLGTLIASMASLISYKFYANQKNSQKGRYLAVFSLFNIIFLVILLLLNLIL